MQKPEFYIEDYQEYCDKYIVVHGKNLRIEVDYDDVNHKKVEKDLAKMVKILNEHWNK